MQVELVFVPPGGGETDYALEFDLPEIPRPGDYISIRRGDATETEDFIVRRTWWRLRANEDGLKGEVRSVYVECEFARSAFSSESHLRACKMYESRGKKVQDFEDTAY